MLLALPNTLLDRTKLSVTQAQALVAGLAARRCSAVSNDCLSAILQLDDRGNGAESSPASFTTGDPNLDEALGGGGIKLGSILEIAGEA